MKILSGLIVLANFALLGLVEAQPGPQVQQTQPRCQNISVRREVRSISPGEWNTIRTAFTRMRDAGWFTWFARMHTDNFNLVHNNPMFFPFHRYVLYDFERIAKRYYPGFVMPYWDSARDFGNPASSVVLSPRYLGSNGVGANMCLSNGIQGGWNVNYPQNRCLRRVYNNGNSISAWYSPEFIESLIQRNGALDGFRSGLEYSLHGAVHIGMGGDMGSREAPNDFTFMLHHANLDRIWWRYQSINGQNLWKYDGNSGRASISDQIIGYSDNVRSVMQLGYGKMCYEYDTQRLMGGRVSKRDIYSPPHGLNLTGLDYGTLSKHYPITAQQYADKKQAYRSAQVQGSDTSSKMPYPFPMKESWTKMHGYNLEKAKEVRQGAIDLIDDLYKSGYSSPYYK